MDRIVERMIEELGEVRAVIATGGLASLVIGECRTITHHEPMITLIGLRMVYERNLLIRRPRTAAGAVRAAVSGGGRGRRRAVRQLDGLPAGQVGVGGEQLRAAAASSRAAASGRR